MTDKAPARRLLLLMPTGRDATLAQKALAQNGIECMVCADWECLVRELDVGAGAALVAEEAWSTSKTRQFIRAIEDQPPWSELPVLMLTTRGADSPVVGTALQTMGNVTLLERPIRVGALVRGARGIARARAPISNPCAPGGTRAVGTGVAGQ